MNLEVRSLDSNFYLLISYLESSVEGCVCLCELCGKYSAMCCASLKLDFLPAPLVQGILRFSEAGNVAFLWGFGLMQIWCGLAALREAA